MKFYTLLIAVILAVGQVKSDMKEEIRKLDKACRAESHVTEDELKTSFKYMIKAEPKEKIKCHLKCLMEKQGLWKNGALDENAIVQYLQSMPDLKDKQDEIYRALHDCKTKKGASDCDAAYLHMMCMTKHKAVHI